MPKSYSVRPYRGGDEVPIVACWNRSLPADTIYPKVFIDKVLCDANFDPEGVLVAVDGSGDVVGFLLAIVRRIPMVGADLEPQNGWITVMLVDPSHRRRGVGRMLMESALAFFTARGRSNIAVSPYAPNYFWPGVDPEIYPDGVAFLESQGYKKLYSPVAMDKNLVGFIFPDDVRELQRVRESEGYRFTTLESRWITELIQFSWDRFNPDWGRAVREAIIKGVPFDRFLLCFHSSGRMVGFAMFGAYDGIAERFGPFGVDDSERGKGLGKILLYQSLDAMRMAGLHNAWFLWTGETSPAGLLYLRAGFTVTRRFHVMRKTLGG